MTKTNGAPSPFKMRLLSCCVLAAIATLQAPAAFGATDLPDRCAVPLSWPMAGPGRTKGRVLLIFT